MKNALLITLFIFCFASLATSQVRFGAGVTYLNDLGVQARANIDMENYDLIPKFSYYIIDNATSISLELDAAYSIVTIDDEIPIYVFGGPALYRFSSNGFSNSDFGFTIGAGVEISRFYGEFKYANLFCDNCDGQTGFAVGYMF